jgi:hypothetical protein
MAAQAQARGSLEKTLIARILATGKAFQQEEMKISPP